MYPKLCNWVLFKKNSDENYTVRDCYRNKEYIMGKELAYFARKLNGDTDPYSIPGYTSKEVQTMLSTLKRHSFLRYGRVLEKSKGLRMYTLVSMKKHRTNSTIPVIANKLLVILWIPVLLFGVNCFAHNLPDIGEWQILLGEWAAFIIGAACHETAHAVAAFACGGWVFEVGAMAQRCMPGAYAIIDDKPVKKRLQKVQIVAAGVEMNMLLTGIALILSVYVPGMSGFFFGFALANGFLALLNTTYVESLDGEQAIGQLLGVDCSFTALAEYTLTTKEEWVRLLKAGPHGMVELLVCGLLMLYKILVPAIYLVYILELIKCFF